MSDAFTHRISASGDETVEIAAAEPAKERARGEGRRADRDRLASQVAIGVIALGFLLMGFGWFGASGKNQIQQQFPYLLSGGLTGLALVFLGGGILVVRDVRRERDALENQVSRLAEIVGTLVEAGPARRTGAGEVVIGRTVYHTPDCRLVEGKDGLEAATREEARARGLTPCRTCEP